VLLVSGISGSANPPLTQAVDWVRELLKLLLTIKELLKARQPALSFRSGFNQWEQIIAGAYRSDETSQKTESIEWFMAG